MAKFMKITTLVCLVAFGCAVIWLIESGSEVAKTFCITLGTIEYHFAMRLIVGYTLNALLRNNVDYRKSWFTPRRLEQKLYKWLGVRKWKARIPTFDPETFDFEKRTTEWLVKATCQAEIVHEVIALLSFMPILAAIPFGELWVFITTSALAAAIDLVFVIVQRYNRPRLIRLMKMQRK